LNKILQQYGIHLHLTCPYTHEQNGYVEWKHRHITNVGLTLLIGAFLPLKYWGEAFLSVVIIINTLPTLVLHNNNPYTKLFHKQPDYAFFKIFECACYPLTKPYNIQKFRLRWEMCLFLGYNNNHCGYICLSTISKRYVSRHVIFNEHDFPYTHSDNPFVVATYFESSTTSHLHTLTIIPSSIIVPPDTQTPIWKTLVSLPLHHMRFQLWLFLPLLLWQIHHHFLLSFILQVINLLWSPKPKLEYSNHVIFTQRLVLNLRVTKLLCNTLGGLLPCNKNIRLPLIIKRGFLLLYHMVLLS